MKGILKIMMTFEDKAVLNKARDIARKGGCLITTVQTGLITYDFKLFRKMVNRVVFVGKRSNVNAILKLTEIATKTTLKNNLK